MNKKAKGIGLLSGGLDSALACLVLRDAGAEVECLHFFTGFCVTGHNSRVGRTQRPIANHALQVAAEIGVPVDLVDVSEEYLPMVLNPRFGYGRNMNPCMDCRVFMLKKARERMEQVDADFVFTGEVLGQRPKSQVKSALRAVEKAAGLEGRLLRPLSAGMLPPTDVELSGAVDRKKLLSITGRGRKRQIKLAAQYGLTAYAQPAGGCCFLTDKAYSKKFKDVIKHERPENLSVEDVFILGVGRHFRLSPRLKVVVGRDEVENNFLDHYADDHWSGGVLGFAGPRAIVLGEANDRQWREIAAIVARYSDGKREPMLDVEFKKGDRVKLFTVPPATGDELERLRV
ncbi:MAG: thiamine biosynthesis protein [Candidatus Latescibacterota bacterium]|nr:MAG: thiamine biosynthesis protein [Candidatus Latescibacterota bacterium]